MSTTEILGRVNVFPSLESYGNNEQFVNPEDLNIVRIGAVLVESWRSDDGTLFYRKYSDGFCVQGGIYKHVATATETVSFPIELKDLNYFPLANYQASSNNQYAQCYNLAVDSMGIRGYKATPVDWVVFGWYA